MSFKTTRAGDLDQEFKPTGRTPNPDPDPFDNISDSFDDIEKFRLTEEQVEAEQVEAMQKLVEITPGSVSSQPVDARLDKLESLVKRIATHLGIDG